MPQRPQAQGLLDEAVERHKLGSGWISDPMSWAPSGLPHEGASPTKRFRWSLSNPIEMSSGRSSLLLSSSLFLLLGGLVTAGAFSGWNGSDLRPPHSGDVSQACDQSRGKCCTTPDGRKVPPGTRSGPYTCLPDGSWG
jgi:hypothetical protein